MMYYDDYLITHNVLEPLRIERILAQCPISIPLEKFRKPLWFLRVFQI